MFSLLPGAFVPGKGPVLGDISTQYLMSFGEIVFNHVKEDFGGDNGNRVL